MNRRDWRDQDQAARNDPYRRDRVAGPEGGDRDQYGYPGYGYPVGFYPGIPGGYLGAGWYDRGLYPGRERYSRDRYGRDRWSGDRDRDNERGVLERAGDEISSWFGDEAAGERRREDHRGRGPRNYRRSDSRLEEDVNDRLTDDDWLDASDITVEVKDQEVTLEGFVASRQAKRRAEDCADSVSGVQHVQNNLRVRGMSDLSSAATKTTTGRQT
ncbi:BON domain-containing protein [Frigidibacter sp. SD6-1]|uniref:BON domain-containing protein n=1 Tax=Frigidibacter sp. SD6-1 TaxID=3032581 RepID=UPI0024DF884C|nr:BON domain-containing protein [Frigidibacter sp. SD6-1]